MEHIEPPEHILAARPWVDVSQVGPPPGSESDIDTAVLARGVHPENGLPVSYAYFKPDTEDLMNLLAGGTVELGLIGYSIQPFSLGIQPPAVEVEVEVPDAGNGT